MKEYKEYLKEVLEPLYQQASQVIRLKRDALADEIKRKAKASTGPLTKQRRAKKAEADLARKTFRALPATVTSDEQVWDAITDSLEQNLPEIKEAANFIKSLVDKEGISKAKAEKAWEKAKESFKNTPKYKDIKDDKKWEIIAGIAKKIAMNEDGEVSAAVPQVTGSAMNTTQSIGGQFAAKLGEVPNYNSPGKYKPKKKNIFRRKVKNESVDINNFIDNLFE